MMRAATQDQRARIAALLIDIDGITCGRIVRGTYVLMNSVNVMHRVVKTRRCIQRGL